MNNEPKYKDMDISGKNKNRLKRNRPYVISGYHDGENGEFRPEIPDHCPLHTGSDHPCEIRVQHYRTRKTGPPFSLLVAECKTHRISFTIYPPGYAPYGRQLLAPASPDNGPIQKDSGSPFFADTCFEAAIDAAHSIFWPYESLAGSLAPRRITQKRHLDRAALILGVAPGLSERVREELATILSISGQLLHDGAALIKRCPGVQILGKTIHRILNAIEKSPSIFERLAEAGAKVRLWPPPRQWDSRLHIFRSSRRLAHIS
jgi:hypothetical protein